MQSLAQVRIGYVGHDLLEDGESLSVQFGMSFDGRQPLGSIRVAVGRSEGEVVPNQIANAHRILARRLVAWASQLEEIAEELDHIKVGTV